MADVVESATADVAEGSAAADEPEWPATADERLFWISTGLPCALTHVRSATSGAWLFIIASSAFVSSSVASFVFSSGAAPCAVVSKGGGRLGTGGLGLGTGCSGAHSGGCSAFGGGGGFGTGSPGGCSSIGSGGGGRLETGCWLASVLGVVGYRLCCTLVAITCSLWSLNRATNASKSCEFEGGCAIWS